MTTRSRSKDATDTTTNRRIVELAGRAPSVHNTQPWIWRVRDDGLELRSDRQRQLVAADPDGRNLVISCGAALHHAVTAAQALGRTATIDRMPDAQDRDLLARVRLVPTHDPLDAAAIQAIEERCTDRRRFTSWPIPQGRLMRLAASARHAGAAVVPLTSAEDRLRVEELLEEARREQAADQRVAAEVRRWIDHGREDGVPAEILPRHTGVRGERASRFDDDPRDTGSGHVLDSTDGLLVMGTLAEGPLAWLHVGEALSALWLRATRDGLSVVPLSQVIEVDTTRDALRFDVLQDATRPQLLLRIGWQEIGREPLPRTPRRPLSEVLRD